MRRWITFRFMLVLMLMAVALVAASSGAAQEATPATDTEAATPDAEEGPASAWSKEQACPDPGMVDQKYMIEDPADGSLLTIRLVAGSRDIAPWGGAGAAIARIKWGRICIEPDTVITAEDGGEERYPSVYVVYIEEGELYVSLTPDLAAGGYAYLYDGNDETQIVTGQRHAQAGDMIVMSNTFAIFSNPSSHDPATIVAVQVAKPIDETGCTTNCWLPSCYMPVAQEPPTCADKEPATT